MNAKSEPKNLGTLQRNLSSLKVVSRLLGHELATQSSAKAITLSREEVAEIQTTIDLFIEETSKMAGLVASRTTAAETHLVPTRN